MRLIGLKSRVQTKVLAVLGIAHSIENLQRRIEILEQDLQQVRDFFNASNAEIIWSDGLGGIDEFEEEMAHLEKIFAICPDKLLAIRWYSNHSGPSEYLKIPN
jgi:hypothetical protein